jgi:DNA-binding CsgD family transcriptional regulator
VREHTHKLLHHFEALQVRPFMLLGNAFAAILAAYDDQHAERATELLALAMTHPHSMTGWLKIWPFIDRLQAHLEAGLGSVAFQAAWERGQHPNVDEVVQTLINTLDEEPSLPSVAEASISKQVLEANAALLEPLSDRELEVLFKIAEGCSNREIADQLFFGLSTVKKHITHIYGKLAVDSRTQALLKAQELGLI